MDPGVVFFGQSSPGGPSFVEDGRKRIHLQMEAG